MFLSVNVSVKENQHFVGIAFLDGLTKKLGVTEFIDNELYNNFEFLLVQLNTKEVIIPLNEENKNLELSKVKTVSENAGMIVTEISEQDFKIDNLNYDFPCFFNEESLKLLSHIESKIAKSSIAALIKYLLYTNNLTDSEKLQLYKYNLSQYMKLDIPALKALSLFPDPTFESNKSMSLFGLLNRCKTAIGSRLLSQWIKQPLMDLIEINKRQLLVEAFSKNLHALQSVQEFLKSFPDVYKLNRKFQKKKATLEEVVRVYQMIIKIPDLINALEGVNDHNYSVLIQELYLSKLKEFNGNLKKYIKLIETTIDFEAMSNHEWIIKSEFDESLTRLLNELNELKDKIYQEHLRVGEELQQDTMKKLKLEQSEIHGWCLRLTRSHAYSIRDKNYIELSTLKSGVYFTTLMMRQYSKEYNDVLAQYKHQQTELAKEVVEIAASFCPIMEELGMVIGHLDVIISFSDLSSSSVLPYVRPIISKDSKIILKESRHPCLEIQTDITFISNDVYLERGVSEFLIITGPNMGGKSTYIRQIGIIVLMAQIGCFVPCEKAEISIFDCILARVGANDTQLKGISTFMAEMLETATILETASSNSLIIIDELGRGTSTADGFGLAWAISEYLISKINAFSLFATHFHELTALSKVYTTVKNLNVVVHIQDNDKNKDIVLMYKVKPGICDQSFGIHVAEMINFPESVVKLAKRKASELENSMSTCVEKYTMEDIKNGANILSQIMNEWKEKINESDMSSLEMLNIFRNIQEKYMSDIKNNLWIQEIITQ
ncbi:uncharacterized protein T551_02326 [Pneumocystis jirovecii RU7]|uniref:DNA mismatch repair protein MSH2 n=1 Tax=Pneumocystis jirovecii (strain RU7) TaxID=1408657 RepID=A0A0W4ZKZ1_PNEJ7|nr:uncharacterized protein T551_02326 [Pneumocystis jirovecii RU7]KTW29052.1 hypothetical protein T551_02326 [Pneumocystis jirovecii RU7]